MYDADREFIVKKFFIIRKNYQQIFSHNVKKKKQNKIDISQVSTQFSTLLFSDIQFFMHIIALAVSGSNLFLVFEIVNPEIENALSDGTDVAWIVK